jgi:putative DNA methylase
VWLKRTIGHLYPNLFSTPLTPKAREIVAYSNREGGLQGGKHFFEENLSMAFREMYRILKQEGLAVIVYAHKSTEGWETVINALLDSGLVVTGAWPMNTEKEGRLNSQETAALASSIYIVTRKMPRKPTGFYNDVRSELRNHLDTKLHRLWEEGIGGADFFIAAIGSAIEVFGKYEQVMDYEGNIVRADRLLEEVRTIATDYAVRQILHNGFATEISGLTRLCGAGTTAKRWFPLMRPANWLNPAASTSPKHGARQVLSARKRNLSACSVHRTANWTTSMTRAT